MLKENQIKKKNAFKNNLKVEPEKGKTKKKSSELPFVSIGNFFRSNKTHKILGIFLIFFSLYMFFSYISFFFTWWLDYDKISNADFTTILFDETLDISNWAGRLGAALSFILIKNWFGVASVLLLFIIFVIGSRLIDFKILPIKKVINYSIFLMVFISLSFGFFLNIDNVSVFSGVFGYEACIWLEGLLGKIGTGILLLFGLSTFIIITFNTSFNFLKNSNKSSDNESDENKIKSNVLNVENNENDDATDEEISSINDIDIEIDNSVEIEEDTVQDLTNEKNDILFTIEPTVSDKIESEDDFFEDELSNEHNEDIALIHKGLDSEYDPRLDLNDYKFPTIELMADYNENPTSVQNDELIANKNKIIETLKNYTIEIVQIKATIGPTVTLYEIVPAPGIRISKIKNLEDDIALSLSALGIRIIAPIPGKGTIGIEVPNKNPQIVSMKTMLSSEKFQNSKMELPIAIGKTIANEPYIADLAKMPHLLMAGATGQGKSVGLNAIIASLLYKKHPAEIKFVLVDPKKVELSLFTKIERHFLAKLPDSDDAIITETRKVVRTLNSLTIEMDQRYDLLKDAQVKNIKEYNTKFIARRLNPNDGHRYLPYIILVVDEFADLIMTAGKEIETPIARLAQLARAIGIHLIIATQRPSVNIITGTIKANFPARIAFRVISKIDSRTILDSGGADQLVGRGDMLLSTGSDLIRLQCAFIDTPEIESIVNYIGAQRGYTSPFNLPEYLDEDSEPNKDFDPSQKDELFEEAARIIVAHQHGSTSLLQRKLKLGYNRAGRIIDQLEAAGIVGPFEGSKAREVKFKDEITLEQFLKDNR